MRAGSVIVATFPMPAGVVFDWHTHDDHQLAWAASGVLTVRTEAADWVLPPTRALWIPAGLSTRRCRPERHDALAVPPARTVPGQLDASRCRSRSRPLLAELIGYLGSESLAPAQRERAEALLADLLRPVPMTTIEVGMPDDERAADVAAALLADPADGRTLAEWGRNVGASGRTLARAFLTGTGMPFGQWRRLARLQAALPQLAAGPGGRHGRPACRLPDAQRLRRRVPQRNRPHPGGLLLPPRGFYRDRCGGGKPSRRGA